MRRARVEQCIRISFIIHLGNSHKDVDGSWGHSEYVISSSKYTVGGSMYTGLLFGRTLSFFDICRGLGFTLSIKKTASTTNPIMINGTIYDVVILFY